MEKKFSFNIRILDEDFTKFILSNMINFLTYTVNFKRKVLSIYKTISFEEAVEFTSQQVDLTQINKIFKS